MLGVEIVNLLPMHSLMLYIPPQSLYLWQCSMTVFHTLALLSTTFRISYQVHLRRIWVDDYLVLFAQCVDIYYAAVLWSPQLLFPPQPFPKLALNMWAMVIPLTTILWVSRLALLFSFSKIFPSHHPIQRIIYSLVAVFLACWVGTVLISVYICKNSRGGTRLYLAPDPKCLNRILRQAAAISCLDFVADVTLVALPLHTFWRIKLRENERRFVLLLFSSNLVTLSTVAVMMFFTNAEFAVSDGLGTVTTSLGHSATGTSIAMANVMVVGSFMYRFFKRYHGEPASEAAPWWFRWRRAPRNSAERERSDEDPVLPVGTVGVPFGRSCSHANEHQPSNLTYASDLTRITEAFDPSSTT